MKTLGTLVLAAMMIGCAPKTDEELFADATESQKASDWDDAIERYQELIQAHPQSPRVAEAMYAVGTIYQDQKKEFPKAIESYRALVVRFPQHATSPNAAFLVGFIFHNELKQLDSAKVAYEAFIAAYPENSLVSSARFELEHLGVDPAQILDNSTAIADKKRPSAK